MPSGIIQNRVTDGLIVRGILRDGLIPVVPDIVNTVAPVISGVTYTGQTLSTTNGTYNVTPDSFTYQWYSGGSPIAGATSQTYDVTSDEEGTSIYCEVTAIKADFDDAVTDSNTLHHFVPSDTTRDLEIDASDEDSIVSSAGLVSRINEKSGNNNDPVQTTGSEQPQTGVDTINGLNVITNDGISKEYMDLTNPIILSDHTCFFVGELVEYPPLSTNRFSMLGNSSQPADSHLWRVEPDGRIRVENDNGAQSLDLSCPGLLSPGVFAISHDKSVPSQKIRCNGTQTDSSTLIGDITIDVILGGYGLFWASYRTWYGTLGAMIVVPTTNITIIEKIEGYLAWKWGQVSNLPGGHPYKSTPPTP